VKIIDRERNKLTLRYQRSIWQSLAIGLMFWFGGIATALMILLVQHERGGKPIFPVVIGGFFICLGVVFTVTWPLLVTFTLDRQQQQIVWERQTLLDRNIPKSVTFPLHLIVGIELVTDIDMDTGTGYYLNLIVARVYWRILLNSDGYERTAIDLARQLAGFLEIPFYPENSTPPLPLWRQQLAQSDNPHQSAGEYLETQIDRLEKYIIAHPQDALAHQELGIALYLSSRSQRKLALEYLHQAQQLFITDRAEDLAAITQVIQFAIASN
jgi:hypothetical protein